MAASPEDRSLPTLVYRLGWISLLADVCSEMVYPVIPIFLTSALGAPVFALGLVEGVAEAVVSLMKGWSGLHSDKTGKRAPYMTLGYGLAALSKPLIGLAGGWGLVLVARTLDRTGKGLRGPARDALLVEGVPPEMLGRASGFRHGMDTAGAFLGSLMCLAYLYFGGPLRAIFLWAFIPGLLAALLTLGLPATAAKSKPMAEKVAFSRTYWLAVGLNLVFAFANSSDTLPLLLGSRLGLSTLWVVALYVGFNLIYTLACFPVGGFADKGRLMELLGAGWALYALAYGMFAANALNWLVGGMAVYGVSKALTEIAGLILVLKALPPEAKGRGIGLAMMLKGFAVLAGNLAAGLVWDKLGPSAAFGMDAILCALALLILPVAVKAERG